MQGFPPAPDKRVTKENWFNGPYNRWGLQHVREITATIDISRGDGPVTPLPRAPKPIGRIPVVNADGKTVTIQDWLNDSYTDALLVLHKGQILAEIYMNGMNENSYHNFFSMSKSFTGNLAGILIDRGQLSADDPIAKYVPEMKGGAYGDAKVRNLLDMNVGIDYTEDYDDPQSDVYRYSRGANAVPNPDGLILYDVLPTFKKAGEHGAAFHYVTANTDALGWVLQRATNRRLSELLSTEIWSKLGAERNAYVICDLSGTPFMGGGFNTTLRDAARFGLMMVRGGVINGRRVVPQSFIKDIQAHSIETNYPGVRYRNQWWVYPQFDAYSAIGVAGQYIMVFPKQDLVVVKLSSWPTLAEYLPAGGGEAYDERAFGAIAKYIDGL
jgi:CubicO group peptidase (beta-lactamase class C family)